MAGRGAWATAAGGAARRLTTLSEHGGYAAHPTWRADGVRIVFSGKLADSSRAGVLLTVAADGSSEPERLGDVPIIGSHPRVEPGA